MLVSSELGVQMDTARSAALTDGNMWVSGLAGRCVVKASADGWMLVLRISDSGWITNATDLESKRLLMDLCTRCDAGACIALISLVRESLRTTSWMVSAHGPSQTAVHMSGNSTKEKWCDALTSALLTCVQHGEGKFTWPDGTEYNGGWSHEQVCICFLPSRTADDLQMIGQGTRTFPDGTTVSGLFDANGHVNGLGMCESTVKVTQTLIISGVKRWLNGCLYVGEFQASHINGNGTFTWPDGRKYVGQWDDDVMSVLCHSSLLVLM